MSGHDQGLIATYDAADFLTEPADVAAYLRVALMSDWSVDSLGAAVFVAIRALERMPG